MAKLLLKYGANPREKLPSGKSALDLTVSYEPFHPVLLGLIRSMYDQSFKHWNRNCKDRVDVENPVLQASQVRSCATVGTLIELGEDPMATTADGRNGLMLSAGMCFDQFLNAGVNISQVDKNGYTALHYACMCNSNPSTVKQLIQKGAAVEPTAAVAGSSPLDLTVERWNDKVSAETDYAIALENLHILLANNASFNSTDEEDNTPLIRACQYYAIDASVALIMAGADVNAKNKLRITPLLAAASSLFSRRIHDYSEGLIVQLLRHGADVNARDLRNWTVLHHIINGYEVAPLTDDDLTHSAEASGSKRQK